MRKLPVFFLIDLSESMVGEPIEMVRKGMEQLIRSLKQNPYALETVWVEIIGFAGKAKVIEPFEELPLFYPPDFPIGGGTALGTGLDFLMKELDANVKKTTHDTKGDWKPLVFIFTDGQPTDDNSQALKRWQADYKPKCQTLVATLKDALSGELIAALADDAIQLDDSDKTSFDSYFKWLTDSIVSSSIQVSEGIEPTAEVSTLDTGISKIDITKHTNTSVEIDDNYTVLLGACQKTGDKYLIKYKKGVETFGGNPNNFDKVFRLEGAFTLDYKKYRELSGNDRTSAIDTKYLRGLPSCPNCASPHAVAVCECGGIFCVDITQETQTCAWCDTTANYSASSGDFDLNRRIG